MHEKRSTKQRIVRVTGQRNVENAQRVVANSVRRMTSVSKKEKNVRGKWFGYTLDAYERR